VSSSSDLSDLLTAESMPERTDWKRVTVWRADRLELRGEVRLCAARAWCWICFGFGMGGAIVFSQDVLIVLPIF